jgi:hypothetical protein
MKPAVGRALAIVLIVFASGWLLFPASALLFMISDRAEDSWRQYLFAIVMMSFFATPGVIVIWRAKLYLRETKPKPRVRRGFAVLPPR